MKEEETQIKNRSSRLDVMTRNFAVLETCKYDMKAEFEASPKLQLDIEQFTDEQMKTIAMIMHDKLGNIYWCAVREAVEEELMKR